MIAADLRRLAAELRPVAEPRFYGAVRRQAALLAYVDRLTDACRALGVSNALGETRGSARRIEVLRVTAVLEAAGLALV